MLIVANIFQPLIDVFQAALKFFHDSVGLGWGTSIVALTVVVRALLLPLAVKQYRSMRALARIAPQLKALQEKYKTDKQRLQQETMRFYQENKVNPFASCLPLLAQLPVFLSLFYVLQDDLRHDICPEINRGLKDPKPCGESPASEFLFIPDITNKATGAVLIALIVLYVGSQLISSLLTMTATMDRNQRMIMLALPFVFVLFIFNFPAGLIVYWITTNLWTIGQQQFLKRAISDADAPPIVMPEEKEKPAARGGPRPKPATTEARAAATAGGATTKAPPPSARRKKKRTGRRR